MDKLILKISFLFVLFILLSPQHSITIEPKNQLKALQTQQVIQSLRTMPLYFVENKGQVDGCVRYHLKMHHRSVYFTQEEIVHQFFHKKYKENTQGARLSRKEKEKPQGMTVENFMMKFIGAKGKVEVRGLDESEARVSFFHGNDPRKWVKGARTFRKVLYRELYPQIDLVVYGSGGRIKYEYHVRPGGEAEKIGMRYEGIRKLSVNEKGQLEIEGSKGVLIEDVPFSYQILDGQRVEVENEYLIENNNIMRFKVGKYRKDRELIIDPLIYSTFLGGWGYDDGRDIVVDKRGNAFVTGSTESSNFPTTPGAYDTSYNFFKDAFVTKLKFTGADLIYSTYLGGGSHDGASGIAIDKAGNAYVTGYTGSSNFPTTPGAFDTTLNPSPFADDAFVTKLNSTGTGLIFSTYLGGSDDEYGQGITVDKERNAYVTGATYSDDFPTTPGAYDPTFNGGASEDDVFITKFNYNGSGLVYSTYLGGTDKEYGYRIAVDENGYSYVIGETRSRDFPTTLFAFDKTLNGERDIFVTKLGVRGTNLSYSTYLGPGYRAHHAFAGAQGGDITVDKNGNAYVTSATYSKSFPTTPGAYDTTFNEGEYDAFVTKLNNKGTGLHYSTFLGGGDSDYGKGIAIDKKGNAYVTGWTRSDDFPTTPGAYDTIFDGVYDDAFVTKLNSSGTSLSYSTYLGGKSQKFDGAKGIKLDRKRSAYVTGLTYSEDFPTTPGAYDTSHNGSYDVFITKLGFPRFPGIIFGKVTDSETGRPIDGAKVKIVKKSKKRVQKSAKTDKNGEYVISDIKSGKYDVKVTKAGYDSYKVNKVKIDKQVELDVELKQK